MAFRALVAEGACGLFIKTVWQLLRRWPPGDALRRQFVDWWTDAALRCRGVPLQFRVLRRAVCAVPHRQVVASRFNGCIWSHLGASRFNGCT